MRARRAGGSSGPLEVRTTAVGGVLVGYIDTGIMREEKWAIMGESTVTYMSPEQLQARYNELASRVGDLEEFKVRGANYDLDADDAAIYDELRDLEFLLG